MSADVVAGRASRLLGMPAANDTPEVISRVLLIYEPATESKTSIGISV